MEMLQTMDLEMVDMVNIRNQILFLHQTSIIKEQSSFHYNKLYLHL